MTQNTTESETTRSQYRLEQADTSDQYEGSLFIGRKRLVLRRTLAALLALGALTAFGFLYTRGIAYSENPSLLGNFIGESLKRSIVSAFLITLIPLVTMVRLFISHKISWCIMGVVALCLCLAVIVSAFIPGMA